MTILLVACALPLAAANVWAVLYITHLWKRLQYNMAKSGRRDIASLVRGGHER